MTSSMTLTPLPAAPEKYSGAEELPAFEFHPTAAHLRFAEALQFAALDTDIATLCRLANVSRAAYYRWQRNPGFCYWMHQLCERHLDAARPLLLLRTVNSALKGDKTALRLAFPYLLNQPRGQLKHDAELGYRRARRRLHRQCRLAPQACASTAEQENVTLVGPLDQPQPEPGNVLVGPEQDAYRDFPSGYRPAPAPVTHPRYTPLPDGALLPSPPPAMSAELAAGLSELDAFVRGIGPGKSGR